MTGEPSYTHLSVLARKKELTDPKTQQRIGNKVLSSALFEFNTPEEAYQAYEKVRVGILERSAEKAWADFRVKLFFHV